MKLQIGQLISAPFLPAVAEVKGFSERRGYWKLEAVLQDESGRYISQNINAEQLAQVKVLQQGRLQRAKSAEAFFLQIEANRIRLAYQFDPQLAVSISQVDPLPHQIEAVYHYVLQSPRIRFLIADDPGAGKTIMAGLVIKELQYRRLAQRVLIVAPGHLKYQWQREMKERFQTSFAIVDRARIESAWGENVWEERDQAITSIDFVKQDDVQATLRSSRWDLIVVDEAHKMSAYAYQGKERVKIDKTRRYQVGEILSQQTNHLLFLTATPHRGDEENFRLFLDLLRPGFFAEQRLLQESVKAKDNPLFVRRLKEDMRRFDGKKIFPPRHVQSVQFRLTPAERELYNSVTDYVRHYFDKAKENRSISFALMILQRRLTSSSHAIYRSLVRRKERLEQLLELPELIRGDEDYLKAKGLTEDDLAEMAEEERLAWEERLEHLTLAENIEDVEAEIAQVEQLIVQAERVRAQEVESKLVALREQILPVVGNRKLLIFTEFRDTVEYLVEKLREWGYAVITIHGQMNMDARIAAEHEFKESAQIMVATEAAGEGINLQFCSLMVNYDIPWNPNRLEQRMGRIHRYGQQFEVFIWNMITQDTREGQILERLFTKLALMKEALGSDRVFDIIGDMIPGSRLDDLLKQAIFSQRRMEEIEEQIDALDVRQARRTLERAFMTSLATRHIDYSGVLRETLEAEENRLVPEYVEDYFLRAYRQMGGSVARRGEGPFYRVENVPYELRRWGEVYDFKTRYGKPFRNYGKVTFDKVLARENPGAEFVAPGHPLLEAVNEEILRGANGGDTYAVFGDPEGQREGVFWFVQGEVRDGRGEAAGRRVFCLYQPVEGEIQAINAAVLWDLEPLDGIDGRGEAARDEAANANPPSCRPASPVRESSKAPANDANDDVMQLLERRDEIEDYVVMNVLFPFKEEIGERRGHETRVKEKYGIRSLDYLIQESNQKILDYQMRQAGGDEVSLPLLNEQRNLEQLQQKRRDLEEEIRLERNLTVGDPRFLGAAVVVPVRMEAEEGDADSQDLQDFDAGDGEKVVREDGPDWVVEEGVDAERRREIELVGMRVAMAYEEERGWQPEDVSGENHGFDVRSLCFDEEGALVDVRYIEVKARAHSGAIRLSANEWKKARRYGEQYWLYVVTGAGSDAPALERIEDPAGRFVEGEGIFATGFIIDEAIWRKEAGEASE